MADKEETRTLIWSTSLSQCVNILNKAQTEWSDVALDVVE